MIFTIFVYIVGVLFTLKGFRLFHNTGTLHTWMSHPRMLVIITNRIIGMELIHGEMVQASKFVVCWTPGGQLKGGTAQALRIATALNIPIINLGFATTAQELEALMLKVDELQAQLNSTRIIG